MAPLHPRHRRSLLPWLGLAALMFFAIREAIARSDDTKGDVPAVRAEFAAPDRSIGHD